MDLDILQLIQQLFIHWNDKQQLGTLRLSCQQLSWTNSDRQEIDLTILLQPTVQSIPVLEDVPTDKNYK